MGLPKKHVVKVGSPIIFYQIKLSNNLPVSIAPITATIKLMVITFSTMEFLTENPVENKEWLWK